MNRIRPLLPSLVLCAATVLTGCATVSTPDAGGRPGGLAPAVPGDPMGVVVRRLDNGLTVMISPNHEEPRIAAWITVRAGSAKDPADATGMAHYLEHMLFKGTSRLGTLDAAAEKPHLERITALYDELFETTDPARRAELQARIDAEGVAATRPQVSNGLDRLYDALGFSGLNAFTTTDQTSYIVNLPANRLEHWAAVESERFEDPVFRLFQTELEAVYEEMNQALDSPGRALFEALYLALFPQHPYGTQPTIGTVEHLKNPSITKMYEYFRTWYAPGNMCIALAGDVDPEAALAVIERHFGRWQPRPVPADPEFPVVRPQGRTFVEVVHVGDEQVALAFPTVPAGHPDQDALVLCDMMLDNGQTGLVNRNLQQTQAVRAAGSSPTFLVDAGFQLLYAVPKPGQTLEECEALLLEQVARLREGAFSPEDLDAVLTDFEVREKRGLESLETRVSEMTDSFVERTPWERSVRSLDRLRHVTKEQVVAAARRHLDRDFVVAYRRTGEPRLPTVTKPAFTPVEIESDRHTDFFRAVLETPAAPIEPVFAVAGRDYTVSEHPWGRLYHAHTPLNDLFDLQVVVETGTDHDPHLGLALGLVVPLRVRVRDDLDRAVVELGEHRRERHDLVARRVVARHLAPVLADVHVELRGREADRALAHALAHELLHRGDLVGGRGALARVVAHHPAPHRAVADVAAGVDAELPLVAIPEVAEAPAREAEALLERRLRHAFDAAQHPGEPRHVLGLRGREREAAVAREHGGDAVPRRRRGDGVPVELDVVVRVRVDEARRHERAVGVDRARGRAVAAADARDAAVAHADVGRVGADAGAVHHAPTANHEIPRHAGSSASRPAAVLRLPSGPSGGQHTRTPCRSDTSSRRG